MISTVYSAGLQGIEGYVVTIECSVSGKLPCFELVGLPDAAIREAKERIRAAAENSGFGFPAIDITLNLAPASQKKEGSAYDAAMLISILQAADIIPLQKSLKGKLIIGELSLSGAIRPVRGVLSMAAAAADAGFEEIYVPMENAAEAAVVDNIAVYGVPNIRALADHLNGDVPLPRAVCEKSAFTFLDAGLDFADVKGQEQAKRALEIAAAGSHNVLLIGPPGTGKSMLAKRIPSILPQMSFEEAIESTKIHSVAGILPADASLISQRPFRSPHHTMSAPSLVGGGTNPTPGEISLAHNGVLFLDEFPEFAKNVSDSLRQPLEDGKVTIVRTAGRVTYPCSFMMVCAMNPCRCGYFGAPGNKCSCKPGDIKKYLSRISGPLIDRIDIQVEMPSLSYDELTGENKAESSAEIRARVNEARAFARARIEEEMEKDPALPLIHCNAQMSSRHIAKLCRPDDRALVLIKAAYNEIGMSARGYDRLLRVSRTIADLDKSETISAQHVAEAIQLRRLDRNYF